MKVREKKTREGKVRERERKENIHSNDSVSPRTPFWIHGFSHSWWGKEGVFKS